jgi:hypothetical protein
MMISRFMNRVCLAGLIAIVWGCTSTDVPLKLSDGSQGYHIYCGGMPYKSKEDCLSRADMMCGDGGYTVLKEADPAYPHAEFMWDNTTHDIVVRCNNEPKN